MCAIMENRSGDGESGAGCGRMPSTEALLKRHVSIEKSIPREREKTMQRP